MKRIACVLLAVACLGLSCPAYADDSDEDPYERLNYLMAALAESALDSFFTTYDKTGDDSAAFVVMVQYYYDAYAAAKNASVAYSTYSLQRMMKSLGINADEGAEANAKMLPLAMLDIDKLSEQFWEDYLNGKTDGKTYLEHIRELYNIKKQSYSDD